MVAENISLVNNFRSQFNRVISNSSYEELVRRLREKPSSPARPRNSRAAKFHEHRSIVRNHRAHRACSLFRRASLRRAQPDPRMLP